MQLLDGIHHIALITADMNRLIEFYERVFDARVVLDLEEEGLRHTFIEVGPGTVLHPFEIPGIEPPGFQPFFQRGRLDHIALNAASEEAFYEMRRRIMEADAGDGLITDMGDVLNVGFVDPDGGGHEVVWLKRDLSAGAGLKRADWTTVAAP